MKVSLKYLILIPFVLSSFPAIAQNVQTIVIAPNSNQTRIENNVSGQIFSAFSLPAILGQSKDGQGNNCLGFVGDQAPDYTVNLTSDFSELNLEINSQGDTTMAIKTPDNIIYCGDDISTTNPDASVTLTNIKSGQYQVWIGAFEEGDTLNYNLAINAQ